jgi:hypothetical protein
MSFERTLTWIGPAPTELRYVRRVVLTTVWLGGLVAILLWASAGPRPAVGFAGGAGLGAVNLILMSALIREIVVLGERSRRRIVRLLAIKVPLVYGGLAVLLITRWAPPVSIVAGFTLVLAVIVLKAIGRLLTGGEANA